MSRTEPDIPQLLDDMRISMERILIVFNEQTKESLLDTEASWLAQDVIARRLSIIGEAAACLSRAYPEFCENHPEIPFREIIGMRNILIHNYAGIDWERIWDTIQDDIPQLLSTVSNLIDTLNNDCDYSSPSLSI